MKKFSEQLHKKAEAVKLQASEKRELRERVVSYMEYHPLPAELKSAKKTKEKAVAAPQSFEPFATFDIPFAALFKTSVSAAILLLVIVPFVAEKSVPGDVLYAVKVQFNEEIRSTLTFDTYQKVEWETERLNRRIAEARLLASEGRLTEEAEAEVAEAVRVHSASAHREIEELRAEDEDAATIASIALDSTLEVQSTSLKNEDTVESEQTSESVPVNLIASAIDESRVYPEEESASSTAPAYDKLIARVERNTTRVYELITGLNKVATGEEVIDVTRRAEDIDRAVQEAINLYETDELAARDGLVEVIQSTQRLIVYITELEVINTVDIETLIPVVLTPQEEEFEKASLKNDLEQKVVEIDSGLELIEDEGIIEKIITTRVDIDERFISLASTTDFKAYSDIAEDTLQLVDDSLKLLEIHRVKAPVEEVEVVADVPASTATTTEEVELIPEEVSTSTQEEVVGEELEPEPVAPDAEAATTTEQVTE